MFCPKCGLADQMPETYCRQCGLYLPDLDKPDKKEVTAEEHLKINSFFSLATAIVSIALAFALYSIFLWEPGTHWIIYLTAGFLTAIAAWQIQVFIRTRILKKQIAKMKPNREAAAVGRAVLEPPAASPLLHESKLDDIVPNSVTERTTRQLLRRSAEPEH